jgi:hypothetical protein
MSLQKYYVEELSPEAEGTFAVSVYLASEVDALIAEKDARIAKLEKALRNIAGREFEARQAVADGIHNTTFAIVLASIATEALKP